MYISKSRQAYAEIDSFLKCLPDNEKNKIPQKLQDFFAREKDKNYTKEISKEIPISEQNLKKETLNIIAMLNLKYWCEDEAEKSRLKAVYIQNGNRLNSKENDNEIRPIEPNKICSNNSSHVALTPMPVKKTFWDRLKALFKGNKNK